MTHRYMIKKIMWNIIKISECKRSEIDSDNANTTFGTTIIKSYRRGRRFVKNEKDSRFTNSRFTSHVIDAQESMIQNESDKLTKKEIPRCANIIMSKVETECIF